MSLRTSFFHLLLCKNALQQVGDPSIHVGSDSFSSLAT